MHLNANDDVCCMVDGGKNKMCSNVVILMLLLMHDVDRLSSQSMFSRVTPI